MVPALSPCSSGPTWCPVAVFSDASLIALPTHSQRLLVLWQWKDREGHATNRMQSWEEEHLQLTRGDHHRRNWLSVPSRTKENPSQMWGGGVSNVDPPDLPTLFKVLDWVLHQKVAHKPAKNEPLSLHEKDFKRYAACMYPGEKILFWL